MHEREKWKWSHVSRFETPWTVAYQAPLSMGFSWQEYWSGLPGLPFPSLSVAQSCPTLSDPHGLQHARLPCPSPILRAYSNPCPSHRWCHPTVLSFVVPFSSHLQSFPASGSFRKSQFFASGGQSTRISTSASVLPVNIWDWFPLGMTGWISLKAWVTYLYWTANPDLPLTRWPAGMMLGATQALVNTSEHLPSPRRIRAVNFLFLIRGNWRKGKILKWGSRNWNQWLA